MLLLKNILMLLKYVAGNNILKRGNLFWLCFVSDLYKRKLRPCFSSWGWILLRHVETKLSKLTWSCHDVIWLLCCVLHGLHEFKLQVNTHWSLFRVLALKQPHVLQGLPFKLFAELFVWFIFSERIIQVRRSSLFQNMDYCSWFKRLSPFSCAKKQKPFFF